MAYPLIIRHEPEPIKAEEAGPVLHARGHQLQVLLVLLLYILEIITGTVSDR